MASIAALVTQTAPAVPLAHAAHAASATHPSAGAIVAAILAALLIVLSLAWAVAHWWAYRPRWTVSLRHCLAEASWRLAGTWEDFADWVKLGR